MLQRIDELGCGIGGQKNIVQVIDSLLKYAKAKKANAAQ
jgi:hypothetical protein